jgi:hypothetical protein
MFGPTAAAAEPSQVAVPAPQPRAPEAGWTATLALTVTVVLGVCLMLSAAVLLVVHPNLSGLRAFAGLVNQQNQNAKTFLYLASFLIVLPLGLLAVPRLADRIARRAGAQATSAVAGLGAATLAVALMAVRLSSRLAWGDGLGVLLVVVGVWAAVFACLLAGVLGRRRTALAVVRAQSPRAIALVAALCTFGVVLGVTHVGRLTAAPLILGTLAIGAVTLAYDRVALPPLGRGPGSVLDAVVILLIVLAVPDTIIFTTSSAIPNAFLPPGIIQFQQDWILGPANQLIHGGAVMVTSPVSQYGVGLLYFLAGWFHLAPIGYGTFGFLDGLLTALFYVGAYCLLRMVGVSRLLAVSALGLGLVALVYNFAYPVGALPEQGPLRFGMPMLLMLATVAAARWPRHGGVLRAAALIVVGISSVWALEAFGYTLVTFSALTAVEVWLASPGARGALLVRRLALGLTACVMAHLILALGTLAATGQLPHWGQYFAYLHALLFGGREGSITYGFAHFSPGLAVAATMLASAAAIVLLTWRAPSAARTRPVHLLALTGVTAYSIALFSYVDNRSSTYILLYVALPLLVLVVLWLDLLLASRERISHSVRVGSLAFCCATAVVLVAAAWPAVGPRFSRSALAHAYPGGGLGGAMRRLWHPPPIDPRAGEGARLVARYLPGRHVIVVLPTAQDLSVELLMRAHRANALFVGFGDMDSFVPGNWTGIIRRQIAALRPGTHVLIDRTSLLLLAKFRADPGYDPIAHPLGGGAAQEEWILRELGGRFEIKPIATDRQGFVVAELMAR